MHIQVKDFMSAPVTVAMMDENILEIRTLMKEKGIHAIPIVSCTNVTIKAETTIKGIITSSDMCEEISDDASAARSASWIARVPNSIGGIYLDLLDLDEALLFAARITPNV